MNAFEAEARRMGRFWPWGHTAGRNAPAREPPVERPHHTLDLRRVAPT